MQFRLESRIVAAAESGRFAMRARLGQQLIRQLEFLAFGQFGELGGELSRHDQ